MIDHAKAMADALCKMRNQYFSQMKFADVEPAAYFREFVRKLDQILAAYDTPPAEAATRENGEIADLLNRLRSPSGIGEPSDHAAMREAAEILAVTDYGYREICKRNDELLAVIQAQTAALSTHQQQGADREVMKTALCVLRGVENSGDPYLALHPNMRKDVVIAIDGLRDALSRAPQPDTVTADQVNLALDTYHGRKRQWNAEDHADMRAALTAALVARRV